MGRCVPLWFCIIYSTVEARSSLTMDNLSMKNCASTLDATGMHVSGSNMGFLMISIIGPTIELGDIRQAI